MTDTRHLSLLFTREIDTLRREVELYPDEALLWQEVPGCPNSGGNLVLHLVGNLRHFLGAQLGGGSYVRDRDAEFAAKGVPRARLLEEIDAANRETAAALARLDAARLAEPFALPAYGKTVNTGLWLLHLVAHLAFHLGQLDYHRRAVTGDRTGAGALPLAPLFAS